MMSLKEEIQKREQKPEAKLSRFIGTFRNSLPELSVQRGQEIIVEIDPQLTRSMDGILSKEERELFAPRQSTPSKTLILLPQVGPIPGPKYNRDCPVWLETHYPNLAWAHWEDLWRLLCTFRIPDKALLVAGSHIEQTDGSHLLAKSLRGNVFFRLIDSEDPRMRSFPIGNSDIHWLARPK